MDTITVDSGRIPFVYAKEMVEMVQNTNEIIECVSDFEKIDLFAAMFNDIGAMVNSKIKIKPIKEESEPYMTRGEKTALQGTTSSMCLPSSQAIDIVSSIQENKDAYGVSDGDLNTYIKHMDVPQIPINSTDLSIVNVILAMRVPADKVIRVPSVNQFFGKWIKKITGNKVIVRPMKLNVDLYGEYKQFKYKALDNFLVSMKQRAADSYSKFSGHKHFMVSITSKEETEVTMAELQGFYRKFLTITRLDDVKKRERHVMGVVQVDIQTDLFGKKRPLDPGVISKFYNSPFNNILELYEKIFISVSHKRVASGETSRINVPSQLTDVNNKYNDIPICCLEHQHVIIVAGSGPINSLIMKSLYSKTQPNDIIHAYDPNFMVTGFLEIGGRLVYHHKKSIEDFDFNQNYCSFYYDVAVEDPQQSVMTKDYIFCNSLFDSLYGHIRKDCLIYASLGVVRNLSDYNISGLYSFTGSPEIYVTIDESSNNTIFEFLETIMSQKMEYNIRRLNEFKRGNLLVPKSSRYGFNEHQFNRPMLNPVHSNAKFKPYSRSTHADRLIPENTHYFNKKPVIIPQEYEQIYNDYINATSFKIRKTMLEKMPIEIASLIHQKSMGDTKIMSSKIRSTLGVKMGRFKPTVAQAQILTRHRDFVKCDEDGNFHLTITGQQDMVANDAVVDRIYKMRKTYD